MESNSDNFNSIPMISRPQFDIQPMGDQLFAKEPQSQIAEVKPLKRARSPSPVRKELGESATSLETKPVPDVKSANISEDYQPKTEIEFKSQTPKSATTQPHNLAELKPEIEKVHMGQDSDSESDMSIPEINLEDSDDE
jgi:hypothetical protein